LAAPEETASVFSVSLNDSEEELTTLHGDILLAEDNPINQEVARVIVENFGCHIEVVENGYDVLTALERRHYDLVLMDCQMPEMDGFEATCAIRQREAATAQQPLPIIALTANAIQGDRERCLAAGMSDYLSKPFTEEQLHAILVRWLPGHAEQEAKLTPPDLSHTPTLTVEPSSANDSPIDPKTIANLRAMENEAHPDVLGKVAQMYLDRAPTMLNTLRAAVLRGDAADMQKAAHSFKSSSGNVGASTLAALCKELEARGRDDCIGDAADMLTVIETEYQAVQRALETEMQQVGS
jgi:CheY-like chemotaxis protein